MSTAVSFEFLGDEYVLRFAYHPDLVAMVTTVPSFVRSWDQRAKVWTVDAYYAMRLAREMRGLGYLVTGLDPGPDRRNQHNGADWAQALFRAVGPEHTDAVFKSLTASCTRTTKTPGTPNCSGELNAARDQTERKT